VQGRGRPTVPYALQLPGPVVTVLLDGSIVAAAVLAESGRIRAQRRLDVPRIDSQVEAVGLVVGQIADVLRDAGLRHRQAAYVAVAVNAVRTSHGLLTSSVLPWAQDHLEQEIAAASGIATRLITAASLLAEYAHVPDPTPVCMLHFRAGDGVSCHGVMRGRAIDGFNGLAGELGHVTVDPDGPPCGCGKRGCLETFCSGPAIVAAVQAAERRRHARTQAAHLVPGAVRTAMEAIWQRWLGGDRVVRRILGGVLDRLAWGMGVAVSLYDPDLVRVGDYVFRGHPEWLAELEKRARTHLIHGQRRELRIEPGVAGLDDDLRVAAYRALAVLRRRASSPHRDAASSLETA
jgi:glucokinase